MFLKGSLTWCCLTQLLLLITLLQSKMKSTQPQAFLKVTTLKLKWLRKVKGSENEALADQFMQFILSDGFQSAMPTGNWMYPVTDIPLPPGYQSLTVPEKSAKLHF